MKTLFIEPLLNEGRMVRSRASFVLLRDGLLQWETFATLLEANGALRAVARAHYHDPAAQCLGLSPPAPDAWQPRALVWRASQQTHGAGLLEAKILT